MKQFITLALTVLLLLTLIACKEENVPPVQVVDTPISGEDSVNEPSEDPVDEPSEDPVDEPSEDPVDEPSEDPVDEPSEEPVDEPSEEPLVLYKPGDYNYDPDQIQEIADPASLYVLANKLNKLPASYAPEDLEEPDVAFSFEGEDEKRKLRRVAASALEDLFAGAKEAGHDLFAVSGYRSYSRQESVYNYWVSIYGQAEADTFSARPGHSEHQTGLTMDISSASVGYDLQEAFGDTAEGKWVAQHAHEYGFIVRYPKDKTDITLYSYEPWHLRYVGKDLATVLFHENLTLEEYFESLLE